VTRTLISTFVSFLVFHRTSNSLGLGTVHGGAVFAILDEAMGLAAKHIDPVGLRLTKKCTLKFKGRCEVGIIHQFISKIVSQEYRGGGGFNQVEKTCIKKKGKMKA
jgi:acyl-coenzyme A thioesterase PaaI-like protein